MCPEFLDGQACGTGAGLVEGIDVPARYGQRIDDNMRSRGTSGENMPQLGRVAVRNELLHPFA